jgi:conjugative relaxase-like TrwC/TraI family protein
MAVLKSTRLRLKTSGSVGAVREYLRTTREYYAQAGESSNGKTILPDAEWWDTTATDRLGLNDPGRDQDEDFAKLLAGYHPRTGAPLVQNAGEAGRCMGLDLTFSPRKEYSLAFVAATPEQREQMTQAFHQARDKALGLISKGVNTRAGKGGKRHVAIDGLVIRAVDHIDSRSGDPQWHCHAVAVGRFQ